MSTDKKSLYTTSQSKIIAQVIIALLAVLIIISSLNILTALLSAVILYILLKPSFQYLVHKKHLGKSLSAILVLVLSLLIIVLPLAGLSFMILHKLILFQKNPEILTDILNRIQNLTGSDVDVKGMLHQSINDISKWAIGTFSFFLNGTLRGFISLIVIYFTLFFMFRSDEKFEATLYKYLPFDKKISSQFGAELKKITYSNVIGQGLIGLCQGFVVAIGFLIFGIPDPLFWGIISVFVCFLPIVGAPIIFVPAGIIELSSGNTLAGVGILIWGAVLVTLIDNFLRQFISRRIANTHPLITIIGVIIGIPFFGFIGLVIGPFMLSCFILLVKMYEKNYLNTSPSAAEN